MIKVAVFEDKDDLRESLMALLETEEDIECVGGWENCSQVKKITDHYRPDVILMDIDMPEVNGLQGLQIVKEHYPNTTVIMLTVFEDDENVFNSLCMGANGYLLKRTPPAKIIEAIHEVLDGGAPMTSSIAKKVLTTFAQKNVPTNQEYNLTAREKDILASLVKGNSYKMIADEYKVSINTVRQHIRKVYEKLQVHSMNEAVAKAIHNKIV